jgi:hypothetical protein
MARNASATSRKKKADSPAQDRYEREPLHRRVICFKFWNCTVTDGKKGQLWDPNKTPGSVYNYRSSVYLQQHIQRSNFDKIGKVSNC